MFYVTDLNGDKIVAPAQHEVIRQTLLKIFDFSRRGDRAEGGRALDVQKLCEKLDFFRRKTDIQPFLSCERNDP